MKTTNNFQKAILKSMAVVVSFVLISFTVNAQNFWESLLENTAFSEIALAMVESNSETDRVSNDGNNATGVNSFAYFMEEVVEEPLEIENWMINEAYFGGISMYLEVEDEGVLDIESWMLDSENFYVKNQNSNIETNSEYMKNLKDDKLEIESWMVDEKVWNN
ncbi:MAG: hypothetical protein GQ525_16470 [Draconibacterium sp.]|nr:hypothetical protein [Draconibacterium sp.]